jgi:methyl-accepting chemotaxis protein
VNKSGQTLGEIVSSVKKVTDIIGEIAAASQEQSGGKARETKGVLPLLERAMPAATTGPP